MKQSVRNAIGGVAIFVNGVLLLPGALLAMVAIMPTSWNLLLGTFLAPLRVRNETSQTVYVTPVGAVRTARHAMPIYTSKHAPSRSSQRAAFRIRPRETIEIVYDWDDIQVSELIVEDERRPMGQVVIDREATRNQYRPPPSAAVVIKGLHTLEPMSEASVTALREAKRDYRLEMLVRAAPLGIPFLTIVPLWKRRRSATHASIGV